ncbi:MAG: hypothetical protein Q8L34_06400 [Candidatus Woesearchaeota archaeon]|nr:hypothetical protein [Candidatus Woesearchaeota archaeon]
MTLTEKVDAEQQTLTKERVTESLGIPLIEKAWDLGIVVAGAYLGVQGHNPYMGAVAGVFAGPLSRGALEATIANSKDKESVEETIPEDPEPLSVRIRRRVWDLGLTLVGTYVGMKYQSPCLGAALGFATGAGSRYIGNHVRVAIDQWIDGYPDDAADE